MRPVVSRKGKASDGTASANRSGGQFGHSSLSEKILSEKIAPPNHLWLGGVVVFTGRFSLPLSTCFGARGLEVADTHPAIGCAVRAVWVDRLRLGGFLEGDIAGSNVLSRILIAGACFCEALKVLHVSERLLFEFSLQEPSNERIKGALKVKGLF